MRTRTRARYPTGPARALSRKSAAGTVHGEFVLNTVTPEPEPAARFISDDVAHGDSPSIDGVRVRPLFGMSFCDVTFDDLVGMVDEQIALGKPGYIVTPNVDHVCRFHRDTAFRAAYEGARLVLCDGMPIIWVAKMLGRPLREKLSGSDLIYWISAHAAKRAYSVYFFGAEEGVAAAAASRLRERYPALKVVGVQAPPFGFHLDPETNADATRRVRESGADIVYVALGSPKQEIWMRENVEACGVPVMIGVGGSFDFVSGRVRRAPEWMQRTSLEWIWRLCQEPRRLWHRYLVEDLLFFKLFLGELWATYVLRRGQS